MMINPYQIDKNLKKAGSRILGIWSRLKAGIIEFLQRRIDYSMIAYTRSLEEMSPVAKELFSYTTKAGKYEFVDEFPWSWIWLEEKVLKEFSESGIEIKFLEDFNWKIMTFSCFVIELASRIKEHKEEKGGVISEKEVIESEVNKLLAEHYAYIDTEIVPTIVEKFSSIDLINKLSVGLSLALKLPVVSSSELGGEISFENRSNVRCLVTEELKEKSNQSRNSQ